MDFGFGGFDTAEFGDFEVDVEDVNVSKKKKYDRIWKVGFGGSVCSKPVIKDGVKMDNLVQVGHNAVIGENTLIAGGTGMTATFKAPSTGRDTVSIEQIRPGMSAEEMQRVREEIVRVASQTLRGL